MKIITWNSQGIKAGSIAQLLSKEQPDVLMIQEAGNMEEYVDPGRDQEVKFQKPYKIVSEKVLPEGYTGWWCRWSRSEDSGNIRCSLAIFWKKEMRDAGGQPTVISSKEDVKRPVLSKGLDGCRFFLIHAGGYDYIEEALEIAARERNWIVAGDFNKSQDELEGRGILPDDAQVFATTSRDYTRPQSARIIDYAVSNVAGGVASIVQGYKSVSDHVPVQVEW